MMDFPAVENCSFEFSEFHRNLWQVSLVSGHAGVLQFPVLAIATKHSFSLAAMC
jgi:hypothetical protein